MLSYEEALAKILATVTPLTPVGMSLDEAGGLYTTNLNTAQQTDTYVLKGEGAEEWEPRFTYHGFRYVIIEGLPAPPTGATTATCSIWCRTTPTRWRRWAPRARTPTPPGACSSTSSSRRR